MKKLILITVFAIFAMCNYTYGQHTTLLNFSGALNGRTATGSLISDGTYLYGMTLFGGTSNFGTVFKIKPDGSGYAKLLDFTDNPNGKNPYGSLAYDGTYLYGMTRYGGVNNNGMIFKIMPNGSGYAKIYDFSYTIGMTPDGSLYFDGTYLYGMTKNGGASVKGNIFKILPSGSGFVSLQTFTGATNGSVGIGSLISDGTFLYGMTQYGGLNNSGTYTDGIIFKMMPNGTGFTKILDFSKTITGNFPLGSLYYDGTYLYGMTSEGGINNKGTLFKIMPNGSGYVRLLDFDGPINGRFPTGDVVSDGTYLYGMTQYGVANDDGTAFKIKKDGTGYSKLIDFKYSTTGSDPQGSLILNGGSLYGMTKTGAANGLGTIFKLGTTAVGIQELQHNQLGSVYPNPSNGILIIELTEVKETELTLYNMMGNLVFYKTIQDKSTIDLSEFTDGVYTLQLKNENGISTKKLILNK
jgi:uncharacterized repeat protein (TIGR03803 family)